MNVEEISVIELRELLSDKNPPLILDVRTHPEVATASIEGAIHIPMDAISQRMNELDSEAYTVVLCHHGYRSMRVALYLAHHGFERVANITGGIDAWSCLVDSSVPRY